VLFVVVVCAPGSAAMASKSTPWPVAGTYVARAIVKLETKIAAKRMCFPLAHAIAKNKPMTFQRAKPKSHRPAAPLCGMQVIAGRLLLDTAPILTA
jgi:hypothetical protein